MRKQTTVLATYPVFLEIASRRQSIRRVLRSLATQPVPTTAKGGAL